MVRGAARNMVAILNGSSKFYFVCVTNETL